MLIIGIFVQAFTSEDLGTARRSLARCANQQRRLDEAYRGVRWLVDLIGLARDVTVTCGPNMALLYATLTTAASNVAG